MRCWNHEAVFLVVPQDMDDEARVGEALTKTIVCSLKRAPSLDNNDHWLNPTEVFTPAHTDTDTSDFYWK